MGFRENLKEELAFNGMQVRELAEKSGVSKRTIEKYLLANGSIPSAENAVKMATVLGVSVEYLVYGRELNPEIKLGELNPELRQFLRFISALSVADRHLIINNASHLANELGKRK
jgi:transcriptional regulator with XRE-family HTH domain